MRNSSLSVWWYWPNIVGYVRVALVLACLFFSIEHLYILVTFLAVAGFLDDLDGYLARRLQQNSRLGAVLDYVTDRITFVVYTKILAELLPTYASIIYLLFMIDMASHMARLYVAIWAKGNHHKEIRSRFQLLNLYYSKNSVSIMMGFCTHSYEVFLIALILLFAHIDPSLSWILYVLLFISTPGFVLKNIVHILQLVDCFERAVLLDCPEG